MEVLDINGKKVYSEKINVFEKYSQAIDLGHLSSGVYYLNLISKDAVVAKKIVKY